MTGWLWFVSTAAGVTSMVLLTAVLVLGVVSVASERPRRTAVANGVHRSLGLGLVVFLLAHIATAILDGYVNLGWISAVLPFTSGYERAAVGLGTLAFDLLLAVVATSLLRHRLPERIWRSLHQLTWALWVVALAHGIWMSQSAWLQLVTAACGAVGVGAAVAWSTHTTRDSAQRNLTKTEAWL